MKAKLFTTLFTSGLLAAALFIAPAVTNAQSATSTSRISQSQRQALIYDTVSAIRDINNSGMDQMSRQFALMAIIENFAQSLKGYEESDNGGSGNNGSISNSEYNRVVDAIEDYIKDELNDQDFDIRYVDAAGSGYTASIDMERSGQAIFELNSRYRVTDFDTLSRPTDGRDDNSDNEYLDDTTRTYNDRIEFRVTFDLEADRRDIYIADDIEDVLEFEIQDDRGRIVADEDDLRSSFLYGRLDSSARRDGDYYRIEEDDTEEIMFVITFEPSDSDDYRLQLNRLGFNDSDRPANDYLRFRDGRYVTEYYSVD